MEIFITSLLLPIVSGVIVYGINQKKWFNAYMPRKIRKGKKKNTVLLIGIGRVGKTQLVKYFTESIPTPPKITNEFSINTAQRVYNEGITTMHFNDYRGQNFGQLVNSFIKEQLVPNTILRYGDINTLILIVDLFPYEDDDNLIEKQYKEIDFDRLEEHINAWNQYALDAVFALLEKDSVQYVCLFINKFDKLNHKEGKGEARKLILKSLTPLIETLKTRSKGSTAEFEVLFGSAYSVVQPPKNRTKFY